MRDAQTFMDSLKTKVWPFSTTVQCSRNLFGDCMVFSPGLGPDIVSPIYTSTFEGDVVLDAMVEDQVPMSLSSRKIGKRELTPEEYDRLSIIVGKEALVGGLTLKPALARVLQSAKELGLSIGPDDSWRRGEFAKVINDAKREGRAQLIRENDVLRNDLAELEEAEIEGIFAPSESEIDNSEAFQID